MSRRRSWTCAAAALALLRGAACAPECGAVDKVRHEGKARVSVGPPLWLPGIMYGADGLTGLFFVPAGWANLRVGRYRAGVSLTPFFVQYSVPFRFVDEPDPAWRERLVYLQQAGASLEGTVYLTSGLKLALGATAMRMNEWADEVPWADYRKRRALRRVRGAFLRQEAERRQHIPQAHVDLVWDDLDDEVGVVTGNPVSGWRLEGKVVASRRWGRREGYTRAYAQASRYEKLPGGSTLVVSGIGRWADRTLPPYAMQMYGGADYFPNNALRGYILSYLWGDWLWNLSGEWRFPLWSRAGFRLGGVVFLDTGGVGTYQAAEHPDFDPGPFLGFGAGVRLFVSDLAIVRLDLSLPRVPRAVSPGDAPFNFVHVGLGQTF